MEDLISTLPREVLPILERFLTRLIDDVRERAKRECMTEVCSKNATLKFRSLQIAAKAAICLHHNPSETDERVAEMQRRFPGLNHDAALAHIRFAMKKQAKDDRQQRLNDVVEMVNQGMRNDQIAYRLGVSRRTAAQLASAAKRRTSQCAPQFIS